MFALLDGRIALRTPLEPIHNTTSRVNILAVNSSTAAAVAVLIVVDPVRKLGSVGWNILLTPEDVSISHNLNPETPGVVDALEDKNRLIWRATKIKRCAGAVRVIVNGPGICNGLAPFTSTDLGQCVIAIKLNVEHHFTVKASTGTRHATA